MNQIDLQLLLYIFHLTLTDYTMEHYVTPRKQSDSINKERVTMTILMWDGGLDLSICRGWWVIGIRRRHTWY